MVVLTVIVPSMDVFENYWYGNGEIVSVYPADTSFRHMEGWIEVTVNYGDDRYRADYQAGRFASGLYFATVEEKEINPGWVDVPGGNWNEPEPEEA